MGILQHRLEKGFDKQIAKLGCDDIPQASTHGEERPLLAYLPYIQGTTDKIGRILKSTNKNKI